MRTIDPDRAHSGCHCSDLDCQFPQDLKNVPSRNERIRRLMRLARTVLPRAVRQNLTAVLEAVRDSLDVPQAGAHHNEGPYMDSHVFLMLDALRKARRSIIHPCIPDRLANAIAEAVADQEQYLRHHQYILLHDVEKRHCLSFKNESGERLPIGWEEFKARLQKHGGISSERALPEILRESGFDAISYYQENGDARKDHATCGAEWLKLVGGNGMPDPILVKAIGLHEMAFRFASVSAQDYHRLFSRADGRIMDFLITATYLDLAASLSADGSPDFGPLLRLWASSR